MDRKLDLENENLRRLWLLQPADSALPIGATAHSSGLETLVAQELLRVEQLEPFLHYCLKEVGFQDAVFCRAANRLAAEAVALQTRLDRSCLEHIAWQTQEIPSAG